MAEPGSVADALAPREGGLTLLHQAPDLTVLHVVWAPGMRLYPHDHQMWAVIGIYAGQEDNAFSAGSLGAASYRIARQVLGSGDEIVLSDDTIHGWSATCSFG